MCLIVAAALVAMVVAPASAQRAAATPPSSFVWGECAMPVPPDAVDQVRCGTLTVPESRVPGSTSERVVRLPVAVIASRSANPQPDPLVFPTSGGPGGGTMNVLAVFLDWAEWARQDRSIILMEQRGDALSTPTLDCPELATVHSIEAGRLLVDAAAQKRQLKACRDRLAAEGVDLSAYTSANSAADLADLRAALGYDRWNLYGISYGARLALTTMRDRPEGLRAVVLDGVYPPNVNRHEETPAGYARAVRLLLASCAADVRCSAGFPDLEGSLLRLLERTATSPITVTIDGPDGSPVQLAISDHDISDGLFQALYDNELIRVLPLVLDQLARGNDAAAVPLAQGQIDNRDRFAEGLGQSIDCAEEVPFNDFNRRRAAHRADPLLAHLDDGEEVVGWCAVWDVPGLGPIENQPVRSNIPTLLTSGAYDPVTPPGWARAAAVGLSHHYRFEFPAVGHGAVWQNWQNPCPAAIAAEFLRDPTTAPDASCLTATPATNFLTPDEIIPTSAVYRLNRDVIRTGEPVQLTLLVSVGAVFALTLVFGTVALVRRRAASVPGVVAAMAVAALHLGFAGWFYWLMTNTDPLILGFGLPASARPLIILPILATAMTGVLVWLLTLRWLRRGTGRRPWGLLTVAVASVVFLGWLISRGLIVV